MKTYELDFTEKLLKFPFYRKLYKLGLIDFKETIEAKDEIDAFRLGGILLEQKYEVDSLILGDVDIHEVE